VSEALPPPLPSPEEKPAKPPGVHGNRSLFILMLFLGVLLLIGSVAVCAGTSNDKFLNFIPFAIASVGSFISVFFSGYRGLFFGFFITLGVIILGAVVLCFGLIGGTNMSFR
jgi:hypothetical protein